MVKTRAKHITNKDIENCIVRPKEMGLSKTINENEDRLVYTLAGKHDEFVDEQGNSASEGFPLLWSLEDDKHNITHAQDRPEAYAQSMNIAGRRRFYVKRSAQGSLFSPLGMYTELKHNKAIHKAEREAYAFKEVSKKVFVQYLMFLKTKNAAWLKNAERELA